MTAWKDPAVRKHRKRGKRHTTRSCKSSKVRYRDRAEAQRALRVLHALSERERMQTRAYECPWCKGWHLTSAEAA